MYLALAILRRSIGLMEKNVRGEPAADLPFLLPPLKDGEDEVDPAGSLILPLSCWFSFSDLAKKGFEDAFRLLVDVVMGKAKWDARFSQVEVTALMELNRCAAYVKYFDFEQAILVPR